MGLRSGAGRADRGQAQRHRTSSPTGPARPSSRPWTVGGSGRGTGSPTGPFGPLALLSSQLSRPRPFPRGVRSETSGAVCRDLRPLGTRKRRLQRFTNTIVLLPPPAPLPAATRRRGGRPVEGAPVRSCSTAAFPETVFTPLVPCVGVPVPEKTNGLHVCCPDCRGKGSLRHLPTGPRRHSFTVFTP